MTANDEHYGQYNVEHEDESDHWIGTTDYNGASKHTDIEYSKDHESGQRTAHRSCDQHTDRVISTLLKIKYILLSRDSF
jgi:hypothetical protein